MDSNNKENSNMRTERGMPQLAIPRTIFSKANYRFLIKKQVFPLINKGKIDQKYPIVIVENSQDYELKNKLEKEHENVRVIIPDKNLGFAKGANLGISEIKTEYIFLNPVKTLPRHRLSECDHGST